MKNSTKTRRMAKRLLSYKPYGNGRQGGRWYKYINNKVVYFGTTPDVKDTHSYKLAETKYLDYLAGQRRSKPEKIPVSQITLGDAIEAYLQHQLTRCRQGDVCNQLLEDCQIAFKWFKPYLGSSGNLNSIINELNLQRYHDYLLARPISPYTGRPLAAKTIRNYLTTVKNFVRWTWKMRLLNNLPRNLEDISRVTVPVPKPRIFSINELRTLYNNATSITKLYILLGLNAGFGQADISNLTPDNIINGYIDRVRNKTNIHSRHKLWHETLELISKHQSSANKHNRLLLTKNGKPLLRIQIDKNGQYRKSDCISNCFYRLQIKTNINNGRAFYTLRKTAATFVEKTNPSVTELFLSHAISGMKKHYIQINYEPLDKATEALREMLIDEGVII